MELLHMVDFPSFYKNGNSRVIPVCFFWTQDSFWRGSTLKAKNWFPRGNFFAFSLHPFQKGSSFAPLEIVSPLNILLANSVNPDQTAHAQSDLSTLFVFLRIHLYWEGLSCDARIENVPNEDIAGHKCYDLTSE